MVSTPPHINDYLKFLEKAGDIFYQMPNGNYTCSHSKTRLLIQVYIVRYWNELKSTWGVTDDDLWSMVKDNSSDMHGQLEFDQNGFQISHHFMNFTKRIFAKTYFDTMEERGANFTKTKMIFVAVIIVCLLIGGTIHSSLASEKSKIGNLAQKNGDKDAALKSSLIRVEEGHILIDAITRDLM